MGQPRHSHVNAHVGLIPSDQLASGTPFDGMVPVYGSTFGVAWGFAAGGSSLTVEDEGVPLATAADTLNFVGAGVTASGTGGTKTITIPGGSATYATPALTLGTANAAGAAASTIRSDATILTFDATNPSTQAFGDAAAVGAATVAARRDHKHGMPATPKTVANDTLWDAAGDLAVGTGADTATKLSLTVPAANILEVLGVVNGETTPTWKAVHDSTAPVTQAFGDAAAAGTALTAAHRDHKHGMPLPYGSSLPAQPGYGTGVPFFYTAAGYNQPVYYDGTRWVTQTEYSSILGVIDVLQGTNAAPSVHSVVDEGVAGAWVTRCICLTYQGTGDATNYVTYQVSSRDPAFNVHNLGASFNTSADTVGNFVLHKVAIGAVVTANDSNYLVAGTKTNLPTGMYILATVFYRLIVT
jgi:hypothetical protein